jgi:hypothetical protein
MPRRVLDGDAMWASTKLSELPEGMIPEYAWFFPLADANGSFEITNFRIIWGKVAAIRPNLTLEYVQEIIRAFHERGLLFTWERDGKRYAHWVGSDQPGRLPAPARRTKRYGPILAPAVPASELREYLAQVRSEKLRIAKASASPVLVLELEGKGRGEEEPAAAVADLRDDAAWRAIGADPPIGNREFQALWEFFFGARNGALLSEAMERCIQRWQNTGYKVPPPFIEAKRRVEVEEGVSTPSSQKGGNRGEERYAANRAAAGLN